MRQMIGSVLLILAVALAACAPAPAAPAPAAAPEATKPAASQAVTETTAITTTSATTESAATTETTATTETAATAAGKVTLPEVKVLEVKGPIIMAGSSTVFPLAEALATRFKDEGYADNITIDNIGSGAGFERFCKAGETDISNASRAINETEVANCKAIGRTPIEFRIGTDALSVVVNPGNTCIKDTTKEELAKLFTAQKWGDVKPECADLGDIHRYIPGTDSGTFDYFVEVIFNKVKDEILKAPNTQLSEDDNVLAQGVEGDKAAIGFFGFAYYKASAGKLNVLTVNGVQPDFDTAESGKYPLARPLFIYSDAKIMTEKPQVAAFINFFLTFVNEEIDKVGYFPASADALDAAKTNWLTATGK